MAVIHLDVRRVDAALDRAAQIVTDLDGLVVVLGPGMDVTTELAAGPSRTSSRRLPRPALHHRPPAGSGETTPSVPARPHEGYLTLAAWAAACPAGALAFTSGDGAALAVAGLSAEHVIAGFTPGRGQRAGRDGAPALTGEQWETAGAWLRDRAGARLGVLELGTGPRPGALRAHAARFAFAAGRPLVRIDPTGADLPPGVAGVSVALAPVIALPAIDRRRTAAPSPTVSDADGPGPAVRS